MEILGKMNKKWALSGSNSREFFNKNGQLLNIKVNIIKYFRNYIQHQLVKF